MAFQAPLEDIRFVFQHLANLPGLLELPGFNGVDADTINAVLAENARFVQQEVAPLNRLGDQQPAACKQGVVQTSPGFKKAYLAMVEAGWQGLAHPSEIGGQGLPQLVGTAVTENLNAASVAFGLCPVLTDGVIDALALVGTPELQQKFLPALVAGRWTGTMNLTEAQAGSDLSAIKTRAVAQSDGSYRLTGEKIFITYGEHDYTDNIVHMVLARTPDAPAGVKGISLFLVPKFLVNDDGSIGPRNDVYCASLEHKLGIHGSPTAELLFGSGQASQAVGEGGALGYLVGEENRGLEYMFITMNAARFAIGLQGVGISELALQKAEAYAAERIQGRPLGADGPRPINQHPDVARMLGIMRGLTEGARALAYVAAAQRDLSVHAIDVQQAAQAKAAYEYFVPLVKAFSTESALEVSSLGLQVHGGMGYIEETGVAQLYRDARILPIYEGTTAIQANDFIARKLVRDAGAQARLQLSSMDTVVQQLADYDGSQREILHMLARSLADAVAAYDGALDCILASAGNDIRTAYAGSVPMLMLAGTVHAGALLARSALLAAQLSSQAEKSDFYDQKIRTAGFYGVYVLPRARALQAAIVNAQALKI